MIETLEKPKSIIPQWWPLHSPIYDINRSYIENAQFGPFFDNDIPKRNWPERKEWIDFLGFKLASRIGVPAGPLLNSKWIHLAANLGFDLVCYKTIRSIEHAGHANPNMIYIDRTTPFQLDNIPDTVYAASNPPEDIDQIGVTNSFGMPSRSHLYLTKDIHLSNNLLHPGQVMVVSVVGTPSQGNFYEDFAYTAEFAKDAGAKIIEANFSCPNVTTCEGDIANDPSSVYTLSSQIIRAIKTTPLIVKVGYYPDKKLLRDVLYQAARAGVRAVSGINTISTRVLASNGKPALGHLREKSGICGAPIREAALDFVRSARSIIDKERLGLQLLACGGIMKPEHFTLFLDAGADIVQSATGMMWDPYLALRYHEEEKWKKNH